MRHAKQYMDERKDKLPDIAFSLFCKHGIEPVSMQQIADAADVGVATLYRCYGTKLKLVIAVSADKWARFADECKNRYYAQNGPMFNAYEEMQFYMNCYIALYQEHRDLLLFYNNFNVYIIQQQASPQDMKPYYDVVIPYRQRFHTCFSKAFTDHSIRTDIPEDNIYFGIMHSMLSAATKYAQCMLDPNN